LAGNLDDHVAGLEAALSGWAVGIDIGDDHAFAAGAADRGGWRQRQTELWHFRAAAIVVLIGLRLRLLHARHGAEREADGLLLAVPVDADLGSLVRRHRADLLGEVARVLDLFAIDRGD